MAAAGSILKKEDFMIRVLLLAGALALAGCGALPIGSPAEPTASPVVIIQTVLVTAIPTEAAPVPSEPPPTVVASPQVVVVTATALSPVAAIEVTPTPVSFEPTAPFPPDAGGGVFTNMTRSGDKFSLRCQPDAMSFGVSTSNQYVTGVDLYYRIQDRLSVSISNWQFGGSMESDKQGNFTIAFPASRVDADLRSHRAWFDYQFVAVNKVADALGRSAKISKQVTYTIDCAD
jgi:hypothetical protein